MSNSPTPFDTVCQLELEQIKRARAKRRSQNIGLGVVEPDSDTGPIQPVGLAFSGGGIRSATFNLGVLQGLADLGVLPIFDYLSTVSGGGYIGSWLVSWIKRRRFAEVQDELRSDWVDRASSQEPPEIHFLREYSNYLTPKLGALSGDTWAFAGAYLRNLLLNQIILGLALIVVLLLSRPLLLYFWLIASGHCPSWPIALAGILLLTVAFGATIANLSDQARGPNAISAKQERLLASPGQVTLFVLFPILAGIWLLWARWWAYWTNEQTCAHPTAISVGLWFGLAFMMLWSIGWAGGEFARYLIRRNSNSKEAHSDPTLSSTQVSGVNRTPSQTTARNQVLDEFLQSASGKVKRTGLRILPIISWSGLAAFVGGVLMVQLTKMLVAWDPSDIDRWHVAYRGFPIAVFIFLFIQILHIGLVGGGFSEDAREWWGRLGGMLALFTIWITLIYLISFDGPWIVDWLLGEKNHLYAWLAGAAWAGITAAGISVGKNPLKPKGGLKVRPSLIGKIAPPVFVLGLLLGLSSVASRMLFAIRDYAKSDHSLLLSIHRLDLILGKWPTTPNSKLYWGQNAGTLDGSIWAAIIGFFLIAWLLSRRVGINRFSMHSLYRNRLVRCYLGASNYGRQPQPFTGIDPSDDSVLLKDLTCEKNYTGPYPIVNTALNLVSTENLAWQQRKSASFIFSPLYSGFEFTGPEGTKISALRSTDRFETPLTLGLAMATSGAAASPNMGSHSEPALSFLMTIFNVRLGWWFGNPRYESTWGRMGPRFGLFYLFNELLGHTNQENNYVYLSDGGHFENLGVYELVRRHCRFIVVCDAGEDHALHFGDLGNAIERCRTDFGIDIEIDIEPLRLQKDIGKSKWHCAIGTIHYEKVDLNAPAGTIVYLKSTLTGDEPTDVQRYSDECPSFPHQSTADQWFTESQFESYRALGQHIVQATFGAVGTRADLEKMDVEEVFVRLRQQWYPPNRFVQSSFTKHTATYTSLLEKMRTDERLKFLDAQVYPEWPTLMGEQSQRTRTSLWLPPDSAQKRAGFYFCNEVVQLMEDVYLDLNLEYDLNHPDNRGWMNLFRHWSWSGMFCATWAMSAGIYGARFQNFCERRLHLRPGRVQIRKPIVPWTRTFVTPDDEKAFFSTLEKVHGLDFWEVELIKTFVADGRYRSDARLSEEAEARRESALDSLHVVPFKLVVEGLRGGANTLEFNIGFALVRTPDTIHPTADVWYLRIQDHMRKMGLAREAIAQLLLEFGSRLRNDVHVSLVQPGDLESHQESPKLEALLSTQSVQQFKNLFDSVRSQQSHEPSNLGREPN